MEPAGLPRRCSNLHISVIFLLIIMLTGYTAQAQRVITEPEGIVLVEGQKASLLCRLAVPINYCRIAVPGEEKVLVLSDQWDKTPGFTYNGAGLQAGQCGVTIDRISARNHGQVKCSLGVEGEELSGVIDLIVALPPLHPEIDVLTQNRGGNFEVDQPFRARCVVRDGRPAANLTWFLNDEPVYHGLSQQEIVENFDHKRNTTLYTTVQEIQRHIAADDNGKFLICRASHIADEQINEGKLQLLVSYRPQPLQDVKVYGLTLGTTAMVTVTIFANPRPNIQWTVDGIDIPQGTQNGRYEAYEPVDLGNGAYNVSLSIAGLTQEDTMKDYYLRAGNNYGSQDYTVRISSSTVPIIQGLDIGAVVGIVIAIVVLLIVVILIIFARATGRWCFSAKSPKSPTSETREDVQSGANSALLHNPNNANIVNSNTANNRNSRNGSALRSGYPLPNQEDRVYNPTTIPINDQTVVQFTPIPSQRTTTNGSRLTDGGGDGSISANNNDPDISRDLLMRGNELGIPESRCSKWIPKDQRELLEKQARLLVNRGNKPTETEIY